MDYLAPIDLKQNELQNAVIQPLASAPTGGVLGQIYYNSTDKILYQHNGTSWIAVGKTITYTHSFGAVTSNTAPLTLVGSDGSTSVVNIRGAGGATLSVASGVLTITTANTNTTYTFAGAASATAYTITITPNSGTAQIITIPLATTSVAGLMAPADKTKLNGIPVGTSIGTHLDTIASVQNSILLRLLNSSNTSTSSIRFTSDGIVTLTAYDSQTIDAKIAMSTGITAGDIYPVSGKLVKAYVDNAIAASDAMIFKGTLGTGGTITALPTTYMTGWTYRIITAGTYAGQRCEVGDLIIALVDRAGTGNLDSDWTVAQTNIDGAITNITATTPIVVSGTGTSRALSHANSGVSAAAYGPTANISPSFGGTVVIPQLTVNATGHTTVGANRTLTIPSNLPTTSANGLMTYSQSLWVGQVINYGVMTRKVAIPQGVTSFDFQADSIPGSAASMYLTDANVYAMSDGGSTTNYQKVIADIYIQGGPYGVVQFAKPTGDNLVLIYTMESGWR